MKKWLPTIGCMITILIIMFITFPVVASWLGYANLDDAFENSRFYPVLSILISLGILSAIPVIIVFIDDLINNIGGDKDE